MKLFQEKMKARMPPTTMPGRASGSATWRKACQVEAPSMRAASSKFHGDVFEVADHDPDDDRDGDDEMGDHQRRDRAHQSGHLEQQEERDQIGQRRRHPRDQDQDREFVRLAAGDAVAGRHADQQADQHRPAGDQDRVPEIEREIVLLEHVEIVREGRRIRDEHRREGGVVELVLQRERDHPEEDQHGRRHQHEDRRVEAEFREEPLHHAFHFDFWRA